MAFLIFVLCLSLLCNVIQVYLAKDKADELSRVTWWKNHYKEQYTKANERRLELLLEILELYKRLKGKRK